MLSKQQDWLKFACLQNCFFIQSSSQKADGIEYSTQVDIQFLLAYSLEDVFVQKRVAYWVAYNLEAVD